LFNHQKETKTHVSLILLDGLLQNLDLPKFCFDKQLSEPVDKSNTRVR